MLTTKNSFIRRQEILKMLERDKNIEVNNLVDIFEVSAVTIRKDLEELSKRGVLVRTHGGASLPEDSTKARFFLNTINEKREIKEAISAKALDLIEDGSTIIFDSGSTVAILASHLIKRTLTVLTNSLPIANMLCSEKNIELIVIGGVVRKQNEAMIGSFASGVLDYINSDLLFLGCTSFDINKGISGPNINECLTKQMMIKSASKVCLLSDSSKSKQSSLFNICPWEDIDYFITDSLSEKDIKTLEHKGVKIILIDK